MHQIFTDIPPRAVGRLYTSKQLEVLREMGIFVPRDHPFLVGEHCKGKEPLLCSSECKNVGCPAPVGTEKLPRTHLPCLLANPSRRVGLMFVA